MSKNRRLHGDSGQMMLAMIFTFMAFAMIIGLVLTTMTGQERTRHDQRFMTSVQGADAGVQQALLAISQLPLDSATTSLTGSDVIDGVEYSWTATRSAADLTWSIESTGTSEQPADGVTTRTVTAEIAQGTLFPYAAFGDEKVAFNGNNGAVSYPETGNGILGTNGVLELKNNTVADKVVIFDWDSDPSWTRCDGGPCDDLTKRETRPDPLDVDSTTAVDGFITRQLDACKQQQGVLPAFVGTSIAARPEPYCFSSFHANTQNFTVTGTGVARVFVEGDVTLGNKNHSSVNYASTQPDSIRLQIYTTGEDVGMYNQSNMAVALYAPNATCSGVTSNAGSDFYGSMICNIIDNVGGWTFHYDTRLSSIGNGEFGISEYHEK
jgi:hypothetical protein